MEQLVRAKSLGGFVRSLSGLFITKENPLGLTSTECSMLAALIHVASDKAITKNMKIELANISNHGFQVITNYINRLKKKGAITDDNKINPVFLADKVTITA